uniref:Sec-independent transporter protein n=1 Tax=Achlya hypogyna TaxID=1202772 RepID=S5TRP0_ACHHY|nr:Sec-independent transporter protein [Achlya hypogyna]AGS55472.1 Sec-independent transporter protein [Achlya hypogyna]
MNIYNSISYFKLHIIELKYNLIIFSFSFFFCFLICSFFTDQIIYIFIQPLLNLAKIKYFIYTEITDIFLLNFYLSIFVTSLIIIPFLFIQCWFFFLQGLNKIENLKILYFYIIFLIKNIIFIYIIFIKIIPNFWIYFYNINFLHNYIFNIYLEPKLYDYFLFIFTFFIYIYIIFICPFILYFLLINNILNINFLFKNKNIIYFFIFCIIYIIIPVEIINQIIYFLTIICLIEIFIFFFILKKIYKK